MMGARLKRFANKFVRSFTKAHSGSELSSYSGGGKSILCKWVDALTDKELSELNNLLNWQCYILDARGRQFGNRAWDGKRCEPQSVPDRRITLMNERLHLADKHVLEVGCFEGIHTVGLLMFAQKVTAVDSRIENVVKTIVRCAMFGYSPVVFTHDVEDESADTKLPEVDVVHHVGVLYHLRDPVNHLIELGRRCRVGIMLDTHYCLDEETTDEYEVSGKAYRYKKYSESGYQDMFSGMYDHAKWLSLADIRTVLTGAGFNKVDIVEERQERNGPRTLLFAERG
jgi:SAM-dependent methyltransferase